MKIDKPGKPITATPIGETVKRAATRGKSAAPSSAPQSGNTSVSLGTTATQLHSMESSMANTPIVNAEKVAEIKQAISEGRFKVNTEVVADRLLETVRELIAGKA